jgi:hypothetical protein
MKRLVWIAFVMVTLTGLPSRTHALAKTMPGSSCQAMDESVTPGLGRGATDIGSGGTAYVAVCSLIRDNTTNTNGLVALQVRVDKGDTSSRQCTATVHDGYGSITKSVVRSVSGSGVRAFDWTTTVNTSSASAYYTITCALGGNDLIKTLSWDEPAQAAGADVKIMPGNFCKNQGAGIAPFRRNGNGITSYPGMFGSGALVQCAPLRDKLQGPTNLSSLKVRMYSDGSFEAGCQAIIGDGYANNYMLSVLETSTIHGNIIFTFGKLVSSPFSFSSQYGLECNLAPGQSIYSVEWSE